MSDIDIDNKNAQLNSVEDVVDDEVVETESTPISNEINQEQNIPNTVDEKMEIKPDDMEEQIISSPVEETNITEQTNAEEEPVSFSKPISAEEREAITSKLQENANKKRNRRKKLISTLIVIVVLIIAASAIWYWSTYSEEDIVNSSNKETTTTEIYKEYTSDDLLDQTTIPLTKTKMDAIVDLKYSDTDEKNGTTLTKEIKKEGSKVTIYNYSDSNVITSQKELATNASLLFSYTNNVDKYIFFIYTEDKKLIEVADTSEKEPYSKEVLTEVNTLSLYKLELRSEDAFANEQDSKLTLIDQNITIASDKTAKQIDLKSKIVVYGDSSIEINGSSISSKFASFAYDQEGNVTYIFTKDGYLLDTTGKKVQDSKVSKIIDMTNNNFEIEFENEEVLVLEETTIETK